MNLTDDSPFVNVPPDPVDSSGAPADAVLPGDLPTSPAGSEGTGVEAATLPTPVHETDMDATQPAKPAMKVKTKIEVTAGPYGPTSAPSFWRWPSGPTMVIPTGDWW